MNRPKAGAPSARPRVRDIGPASLRTVGLIAAGGFVLGVVWPRLAGVSLVPEVPLEEARTALDEEPTAEPAAPSNEGEAKQLTLQDTLEVGEPEVTSCRDAKGKEQKTCDAIEIDGVAHAPLRSLGECPGAQGAFGTLSLGFEVEFDKKRVSGLKAGRSTDLPGAVAEELLRCAKRALAEVQLSALAHEHQRYTVFYRLKFKTPEAAVAEQSTIVAASGQADVRWQTALVRESPERDSKVKERVLSGTRLLVTGRKGEWYRVKYDSKGREGWVHGAALGLPAGEPAPK